MYTSSMKKDCYYDYNFTTNNETVSKLYKSTQITDREL